MNKCLVYEATEIMEKNKYSYKKSPRVIYNTKTCSKTVKLYSDLAP